MKKLFTDVLTFFKNGREGKDPLEDAAIEHTASYHLEVQRMFTNCPPAVQHVLAAMLTMVGFDEERCGEFVNVGIEMDEYYKLHQEDATALAASGWDDMSFIVPGSDEDIHRLENINDLMMEGRDAEAETLARQEGIGAMVIAKMTEIHHGRLPFLNLLA